jgi:hypothetical protein
MTDMASQIRILITNEIRMLWNQFKRALRTPSMLVFYAITIGGAFFVSSVVAVLANFQPLFENVILSLGDYLDLSTILAAVGFLTLTAAVGGYFGLGPAAVLETSDENIMMPAPVEPFELFIGRYTRRIVRKTTFAVVTVFVALPLIWQSAILLGQIVAILAAIILFLEFNYLLGGTVSQARLVLKKRTKSPIRHLLLVLVAVIAYLPSAPVLNQMGILLLISPANNIGLLLLDAVGFISVPYPSILVTFLVLWFVVAFLSLALTCDFAYYELFAGSLEKKASESRLVRIVRGEVDFSDTRVNDPMIWIMLKDFWSRMRSPLQFWKYVYAAIGSAFVIWLHLYQPDWIQPIEIPSRLYYSTVPAFLLVLILVTQAASMIALFAFVDEGQNIYLLKSSPFHASDIVLAKYLASLIEVAIASIPVYAFIHYFFRIPGGLVLITLGAPLIMVFCATGVMIGAYVPVFTNNPKNPPVPLAFSFPAINLLIGALMIFVISSFADDILLVAILPGLVIGLVVLFLALSVRALEHYK